MTVYSCVQIRIGEGEVEVFISETRARALFDTHTNTPPALRCVYMCVCTCVCVLVCVLRPCPLRHVEFQAYIYI